MEQLRPIHEQVVVITGASSGIGRETALQFAEKGATVIPIARSQDALETLREEIERLGGRAHPITADVSDYQQIEQAATTAVEKFGRIDTWVNNAATSLYATVEESTIDEIKRMIDVTLMGQIHGMKAALPHLKQQGRGSIINVASALAKRSVPLQAAYCAAKHGIKGFTESLRLELEHEGSDINVTLILPSSINTPLFEHARSKMTVQPQPLPPVFEPGVVAEAILFAATHPRRAITVGGPGKMLELLERINPKLADRYMLYQGNAIKNQQTNQPDDNRDNLFEPMPNTGRTTGNFGHNSKTTSLYTRTLEQHPQRKRLLLTGTLTGLGLLLTGALLTSRTRAGRDGTTAAARRQSGRAQLDTVAPAEEASHRNERARRNLEVETSTTPEGGRQ